MNIKALTICILLILISGLTMIPSKNRTSSDLISDIRAWALDQNIWSELQTFEGHTQLIAVREIYQEVQSQLKLRVYLLTPCRNLCGEGEDCARHCQKLIQSWKGEKGDARLLIEAHDLKHQRLIGRVLLTTIAPVKLRYWSRKQRIIAFTQQTHDHFNYLHLLDLVSPDTPDRLEESNQLVTQVIKSSVTSQTSPEDQLKLRYYDRLSLGPFSGLSEMSEGATNFIDIDGDQRVELVAPFDEFVQLTPLPLAIPVPYRFTPQGLVIDTSLIKAEVPQEDELRSWITQKLGTPISTQSTSSQIQVSHEFERATPLFIHAIQLCLISRCAEGNELVHFAYPQHQVILRVWSQLQQRLSQRLSQFGRDTSFKTDILHPYSTLNQRFPKRSSYQDHSTTK